MPSRHARAIYVVSFDCGHQGVERATRFVCDVIPAVYERHRHEVQGFFLSRHWNLTEDPPYNTVWLNYRLHRTQAADCKQAIAGGLREIVSAHRCLRADWKSPDDKDKHFRGTDDEEEGFHEIPEWPGIEFLPTLWAECEFATLQAYRELASQAVPLFFHPWSRHILRNVLGVE